MAGVKKGRIPISTARKHKVIEKLRAVDRSLDRIAQGRATDDEAIQDARRARMEIRQIIRHIKGDAKL